MRGAPAALALLALAAGCASSPEYRGERDRAVRAGLRFLDDRLRVPEHAEWLGIDAVAIFADFAASSADPVARDFAAAAARRHGRRLADHWLGRERLAPGELLDLVLLLSLAGELGLDRAPLERAAARDFARLARPDDVYELSGTTAADLDALPGEAVFSLLLSAYAVERAAAAGYDFGTELGLRDVLAAIRRRPRETAREVVYLETHVAYVLSDYGRLRLGREDAPGTFAFLERSLPGFLAAGDVELVAEIVDVLRSLDRSDADPLVRDGTRFLLATQAPDGSWAPTVERPDPYDALHPTWAAVMGLMERRFRGGTPYDRRLRRLLPRP